MSLKSILVHLDHSVRSEQRLDLAISLALRHQAHLSGYYSSSKPLHSLSAGGFTAAEMSELFRQKTDAAGLSTEWIDSAEVDPLGLPPVQKLILHSYYADLVIVGQLESGKGDNGLPSDFPERVALLAGRPVLVIPRNGKFSGIGERVMVAWRGGRASSRALYDSIPLLRKAKQVDLVLVNPLDMSDTEARNLSSYMIRNTIAASCRRVIATDLSAGNILLNQACDLGADLLVIGLFSVNRRAKVVVGPAGRHLLDAMTIPLLISG
jgi:nucleotide-binding universal stress UspA family protein